MELRYWTWFILEARFLVAADAGAVFCGFTRLPNTCEAVNRVTGHPVVAASSEPRSWSRRLVTNKYLWRVAGYSLGGYSSAERIGFCIEARPILFRGLPLYCCTALLAKSEPSRTPPPPGRPGMA